MENKPTKEEIKAMVEEVFKTTPIPERRIKGMRGCALRGGVDLNDFTHCGLEECGGCDMARKAMNNAMNDMIKQFKNEN